jgi:polysaccharide export outer membrane protein
MCNRGVAVLLCVLLSFNEFVFAQAGADRRPAIDSETAACAENPNGAGCANVRAGSQTLPNANAEPASSTAPTSPAAQAPDENEFQEFVASSLGRKLSLFGYNLFDNVPSTFAPVDRIPVPADYVIGPGDELLIRAWGQIEMDAHVVVDRTGAIFVPKVGSVSVAGLKYQQLPDSLRASIGRVFRNFDLTVTMGQLRSIQIFVVGYARRPGSYTVSSLSTLVNALFASGGPSMRGSMRHIQLKRNGKVVTEFDVYDLLQKGDKSKDVLLMPGDVIYIPPVGPQVAMAGSVNFPAIYELRGVTTLGEQIDSTGGLTSVADGQRVIVERIEGHTTRKVDEFKLDAAGMKREIRDGDLVRVFSLSPKFDDAVTIRGNVAQPGRYPWHEGMRVHDLIPNREFLLTRTYWQEQNVVGGMPATGSDWGTGWQNGVASVTNSDPKTEVRNEIKRSAPEINWDYAVIQRADPVDLSTSLIPFNLGKALSESGGEENVLLRAGDVVTIFSQNDMAVAMERRSKFVRLEGEFLAPGVYKVAAGETLRSVIKRAGGLTPQAYLFGTQFTRESARVSQQKSLDQMVKDLEVEVEKQTISDVSLKPEQQDALKTEHDTQRTLIQKLSQIKAEGRVVLEIDPRKNGAEALPDIALEDGDRVLIPHESATVSVVGSVYSQSSYLFRKNMRIQDYLKMAGNGTRDADTKHTFIVRADGSVLSKQAVSSAWSGSFNSIRALPGDTIVVPTQLERGSFVRGLKDWSQIIGQFGLAAAAIGVWTH